jgi:hypothetical protein
MDPVLEVSNYELCKYFYTSQVDLMNLQYSVYQC